MQDTKYRRTSYFFELDQSTFVYMPPIKKEKIKACYKEVQLDCRGESTRVFRHYKKSCLNQTGKRLLASKT
ncbi:conserved hypothetical protein [Ricinus communis]|uniref:Uncharacterized protein n=1 Tax=Ricinus communis TaxID=3988 RepID=B9T863_RICCO|nr:conserved hypothetical protein [Ricinus communis]